MVRLAVIGALMWGLLGLTILTVFGCAAKPEPQIHDELIQWNYHAQPVDALLEA